MTINKKIKALREEKGLSQQEVADAIFTTQTTISNIENGRTALTVPMLIKLAQLYKVEAHDLISNDNHDLITIIKNGYENTSQIQTLSTDNIELIQSLMEQLAVKDKQINQLLSIIEKQSNS